MESSISDKIGLFVCEMAYLSTMFPQMPSTDQLSQYKSTDYMFSHFVFEVTLPSRSANSILLLFFKAHD